MELLNAASKKDGIIALCLFVYWMVFAFIGAMLIPVFGMPEELGGIVRIALAIFNILIVLGIVSVRKQGLASIGLHTNNIRPALCLGLAFAIIPLVLRGLLPGLVNGWELNSPVSLLIILGNTALMAVREDVTFVGLIQTRLHGIVKNENQAINLGAVLFTLVHVPQYIVEGVRSAL